MNKELFEFLSVHFQTIFSTKKKKAFLNWAERYLSDYQTFQQKEGLLKKQHANKLIVVNYTTDEKCWFGQKFLTQPEMNRFFQKVKVFKIICLLLSVLLLFVTYHWFRLSSYWLTALYGGLTIISYVIAVGVPQKYNFSKIATLTTAIEIFRKDATCDLLFIEENTFHIKAQKNMYQEIFIFGDLYGTQELYAAKLLENTYFIHSGKVEAGEIVFFNSCRQANLEPPQNWYNDLADLKKAAFKK
ncbi:hypothetical protein GIX45_08655 [Erwinia sp. CPCC 100877]|nr:hypothetical protein [Erwinia sp. CPCC 100877]